MTTEERLAALEAQMAELLEPPTEYYTSRYGGEEIDKGIDGALQLGGATTPQVALANLGAGVRPNLLINPFFKVNQRRQSRYSTGGYCVDGWKISYISSGTYGVSVHDDYITISAGADRETRVDQAFEDKSLVLGKTVTGSALLNNGTLVTGTDVFKESDGTSYATETLCSDSDFQLLIQSAPNGNALVRLVAKPGKSVDIKAVKLEVGDTQTLAYQGFNGDWELLERVDPLEELKCKRFQVTLPYGSSQNFAPLAFGYGLGGNSFRFFISTPVKLRKNPSIEYLQGDITGLSILTEGTTIAPSSISQTLALENGVGVNITVPSGSPANVPAVLRCTSAYVLLNANLL